ncbi:hypothetical protein AMECASPLE_025937, partial [Ameca splendens]
TPRSYLPLPSQLTHWGTVCNTEEQEAEPKIFPEEMVSPIEAVFPTALRRRHLNRSSACISRADAPKATSAATESSSHGSFVCHLPRNQTATIFTTQLNPLFFRTVNE